MPKIALVGSANSVTLAPYEDQSFQKFRQGLPTWPPPQWKDENWEVWACSPGAAMALRRCTRFFELHRWEPGQQWFPLAYCNFLREFQGPVYVGSPNPYMIPKEAIPNQVQYPIQRVEETFSSFFLTSSLALMFALAIFEIEDYRRDNPLHNWEEDVIGFWGVDMAAEEEWATQRPGCQFFLLEAFRKGIGIYVPPESCLLRPEPVYGLSEWQHNYIKLTQRAREINGRMQDAMKAKTEAETTLISLAGAQKDLNYMVKTWTSFYGMPAGEVLHNRDMLGMRKEWVAQHAPESRGSDQPSKSIARGAAAGGNGASA